MEKMETRIVATALVLFTFVVVSSHAATPEPNSFAICKYSGIQSYPAVSGNIVVWQDNRNDDTSNHVFTIFKCNAKLTADLNGDCAVDFTDFTIFGRQWLACGNTRNPNWCQ